MDTVNMYLLIFTGLSVISSCLAQDADTIVVYGQRVLPWEAYETITGAADSGFLVLDPIQSSGSFFAVELYVTNTNPVTIQLLRPVTNTPGAYQVVAEFSYTPAEDEVNTRVVVQLSGTQCAMVQSGDFIGFVNTGDLSSIGYVFDSSVIARSYPIGNSTTVNHVVVVDALELPYRLALAAFIDTDMIFYNTNGVGCRSDLVVLPSPTTTPTPHVTTPDLTGPPGSPGEKGDQGIRGPQGLKGDRGIQGSAGTNGQNGIQGQPGIKGDTGDPGSDGPIGPEGVKGEAGGQGIAGAKGAQGSPGVAGERGPPGAAGTGTGEPDAAALATDESCKCGEGLLHPYLILGLIIWLLILTLIVIMLLVLLTRRHNEFVKSSRESVRTLQRDSPWIVDTRDDNWKEYTMTSDRMSERLN